MRNERKRGSEGYLRRFFVFSEHEEMYLPDPLFALVLSYFTDGEPAQRILAGWVGGRADDGWQQVGEDRGAVERLRAPGRHWGEIKRLIDACAYLIYTETPAACVVLHCKRSQAEDIVRCLRPWNRRHAHTGDFRYSNFWLLEGSRLPKYEYPRMFVGVSFWFLENRYDVEAVAAVEYDGIIFNRFIMRECLPAGPRAEWWSFRKNVFIL